MHQSSYISFRQRLEKCSLNSLLKKSGDTSCLQNDPQFPDEHNITLCVKKYFRQCRQANTMMWEISNADYYKLQKSVAMYQSYSSYSHKLRQCMEFCHLKYTCTRCPKKNVPFNFLNNSVKNKPISTIFGVRNPGKTCDQSATNLPTLPKKCHCTTL